MGWYIVEKFDCGCVTQEYECNRAWYMPETERKQTNRCEKHEKELHVRKLIEKWGDYPIEVLEEKEEVARRREREKEKAEKLREAKEKKRFMSIQCGELVKLRYAIDKYAEMYKGRSQTSLRRDVMRNGELFYLQKKGRYWMVSKARVDAYPFRKEQV